MIYHDITQNSDEWFELRKGKFTASTFKDLFYTKAPAKGYYDTIYQFVFERLTGERPESYSNAYMRRGSELEPEAREFYELEKFTKVHNGGFFESEDFKGYVGCSPDGIINPNGLLEVKCPAYNTMIDYLLSKSLPSIYKYQVHGQIWIAEKEYCDFIAYHPSLPKLIIRINRDEKVIKELKDKLEESIIYASKIINQLKQG